MFESLNFVNNQKGLVQQWVRVYVHVGIMNSISEHNLTMFAHILYEHSIHLYPNSYAYTKYYSLSNEKNISL
jgi:hypothetical protein